MEKDKLILIGLAVMLVVLMFAFFGVLAVTGYVMFFMNEKKEEKKEVVPLYEGQDKESNENVQENEIVEVKENNEQDNSRLPAAVCGNNTKEAGEECEIDSECGENNICKACKCEPKPVEEPKIPKLENLKVQELAFFCVPSFEGNKGLAIKIIDIKNTGQTDFSYLKPISIKAEIEGFKDTVNTKNTYKFSAKAGKTSSIYQKDLDRENAPFIFAGNKTGQLKLTITFGNTGYLEHEYQLKAVDFGQAGCI